ncbi:hypothetical protein F2Q70_00012132 [Brassica cretica]|uniref:Uncharacterized protein n=1 Tax=Brassica cretica TaxID=69181 RepID=A0A8S9M795_BRACR|nr:hypothetical protein F2Q70_00012132 [Brassica cretica]
MAAARGSVGSLLYPGSMVCCDGVSIGGVVRWLVKMALVLGSRGRHIVGFCSAGGVYRRMRSAEGTRHGLVVKARLSVRVSPGLWLRRGFCFRL